MDVFVVLNPHREIVCVAVSEIQAQSRAGEYGYTVVRAPLVELVELRAPVELHAPKELG